MWLDIHIRSSVIAAFHCWEGGVVSNVPPQGVLPLLGGRVPCSTEGQLMLNVQPQFECALWDSLRHSVKQQRNSHGMTDSFTVLGTYCGTSTSAMLHVLLQRPIS